MNKTKILEVARKEIGNGETLGHRIMKVVKLAKEVKGIKKDFDNSGPE